MSMAGRPTFVAARGGAEQGGYRRHNPSAQFSSRDLASHTKMKVRQPGQNTNDEVAKRDLKRELEEKEKKGKKDDKKKDEETEEKPLAIKEKGEDLSDSDDERRSIRKEREREKRDKNHNIDADDSDDSDSSDEDTKKSKGKGKAPAKKSKHDSDSDSDDDSDDSEDETDELMRELERIKKEREQDRIKQEQSKMEEEAKRKSEAVIHGNPLLSQDYSMKRKWYDDVVFKNQARDEPEQKKRFINDTTRNDFARKFLTKYIK